MTTRWGILATGRIAHTLAKAIQSSQTGELVAVGSRTQPSADAFAEEFGGLRAHGAYQALIDDTEVDAIYIAVPHPQHVEWTIKALKAKKSVLCEKPMGLNHAEVMAMVHAARENQSLLLEAFMYRMHPQTQKLKELIEQQVIGEVRHINASFGFNAPFNPESRLYAAELGGGGIMDVGCYPVSLVRMIVGSEPTQVTATGQLAETGVDIYTSALLAFDNGVGAHVATGVGQQLDNSVSIYGSKGSIHVSQPWLCPQEWEIQIQKGGERTKLSGSSKSPYVYQVDEVDQCREQGLIESPAMDLSDSLNNARVLDSWRARINLSYPQERPETLSKSLVTRPGNDQIQPIPMDSIEGVDKQLSRVVMGCDNQPNLSHASVMFDHFREFGGNVFDTAHIYGGGSIESLLGQWVHSRNVREEIAIIGKGAHTPLNRPEYCRPQLEITLERLKTDYIDIYFLHRDNDDVPVGEWFDALDELRAEGLIRVFGGSNWHFNRIEAARQYGKAQGKEAGFTVVSNQFSLSEMLQPVWSGCISASDTAYKQYLSETENIALFPWSSQGRGFFTKQVDDILSGTGQNQQVQGNQPNEGELRRCWFSDDNFERRKRAIEMAEKYEVEPINIALAYVLAQSFKTFPLIGPRYLWETSSSLRAFNATLTQEDLDWLDLNE